MFYVINGGRRSCPTQWAPFPGAPRPAGNPPREAGPRSCPVAITKEASDGWLTVPLRSTRPCFMPQSPAGCSLSHKGTGVLGSRVPELFPMGKPKGRSRRPLSPCPFCLPSDVSQNATTQTIGGSLPRTPKWGSGAPMGRGALWSRVMPLSPSTQPEELDQLPRVFEVDEVKTSKHRGRS